MIIKNFFSSIIILLCLALLNGCPKTKSVGENIPDSENEKEQVVGRYYPLELPSDKEIIPAKYPVNSELNLSGNFIISDAGDDSDDNDTPVDNIITAIDTANSQAFRIQILTSKVYSDVRRAKMVAEEIFDHPVFLDYEVPYYKLRVGSFADRDKAEDYLQYVRQAGYNDAWVVVVNTSVKSLSPLYDDEPLPVLEDTLPQENQNENSGVNTEKTVIDE